MKNIPGYPEWMIKLEKKWGDRSEGSVGGKNSRPRRVGRGVLRKLKRRGPKRYKKGSG